MNPIHYSGDPFSELEPRDSRWRKNAFALACLFVGVLIMVFLDLLK
jgi:hypothetical protein